MRKFKVGDLVTVVENGVWHTHLNDGLRKTLIGKTGTVTEIDQLVFTKNDVEWWFTGDTLKKIDGVPDDYEEIIYNCKVRFPHMPERNISFAEAHLIKFIME